MARHDNTVPHSGCVRAKPNFPNWFYHPNPGQCRWCGRPIKRADGTLNTRKRWHAACLDPYFVATRSDYAAQRLFERDGTKCACCGLDVVALANERDELIVKTQTDTNPCVADEWATFRHKLMALGFKERHLEYGRALYECDHVRSVWSSNGALEYFALTNMQILDAPCHSSKTRVDTKVWRAWHRAHCSVTMAPEIAALMDWHPENTPHARD